MEVEVQAEVQRRSRGHSELSCPCSWMREVQLRKHLTPDETGSWMLLVLFYFKFSPPSQKKTTKKQKTKIVLIMWEKFFKKVCCKDVQQKIISFPFSEL